MMDRSRDLSTIEKTFAQGRIMHLQSIFHYGDFINATIRECSLFPFPKYFVVKFNDYVDMILVFLDYLYGQNSAIF